MKNHFFYFVLCCAIVGSKSLLAQTSTLSNTSSTLTDYLGWESNVSFDLNILHKNTEPVRFCTNNIERIRITALGNVWLGAQGLSNALTSVSTTDVGQINNYAIYSNSESISGYFTVENGEENSVGLLGQSVGGNGVNYGLFGAVCNGGIGRSFAVYGSIPEFCQGGNNFAGYFEGNTFTPGGIWSASDASLKLNIEPLNDCLDMIEMMTPKSYRFKDVFCHMQLPEGIQYGLLAQDLATVIPHAVSTIMNPADFDDDGLLVNESVEFNGIDYSQLIPVLIGAFQERQTLINTQTATISELEERIAQAEARAAVLRHRE